MLGFLALVLVVAFILWYSIYREPPTTHEDVRTIISQALTETGLRTPAAIEDSTLLRLHDCAPVPDDNVAERSCDDICARTCVFAGTAGGSGYRPIGCGQRTTERLVCHCC